MAEFLNPFSGVIPGRKISDRELTRGLRQALAAEEEAVHLYESLADATENKLAQLVLQSVANEERQHAGEFQRLLNILLPDETVFMGIGGGEVDQLAAEVKGSQAIKAAGVASSESSAGPTSSAPTVGDLKK